MSVHFQLHYVIAVASHAQPAPGDVSEDAIKPAFRKAKRELVDLQAALQCVLENYGYALTHFEALRGELRTLVRTTNPEADTVVGIESKSPEPVAPASAPGENSEGGAIQ